MTDDIDSGSLFTSVVLQFCGNIVVLFLFGWSWFVLSIMAYCLENSNE